MDDTTKHVNNQISDDEMQEETSSLYNNTDIDTNDPEYEPLSSNAGGLVSEKNITDENTVSANVGDQGHWGIDDNTG